jgi:hypothetical protein
MIRHEISRGGALGLGLAQAVGVLTVAVIETAFLRLLMPAVGGPPLSAESRHPAGVAAASFPPRSRILTKTWNNENTPAARKRGGDLGVALFDGALP